MADTNVHLAKVLWAQRNDKLYITIDLSDVKDHEIELKEETLHFTGKGGTELNQYEVKIEFYDKINTETSKYVVRARNIEMVLMKAEPGPYWPRVTKQSGKVHWLKTDFNKWKDEDEEEEGEGGAAGEENLQEMMAKMGGFNSEMGTPADNKVEEEEEDSDDEQLPDLE